MLVYLGLVHAAEPIWCNWAIYISCEICGILSLKELNWGFSVAIVKYVFLWENDFEYWKKCGGKCDFFVLFHFIVFEQILILSINNITVILDLSLHDGCSVNSLHKFWRSILCWVMLCISIALGFCDG